VAGLSNKEHRQGKLEDVITGFDAIVGVSSPGSITAQAIQAMSKDPIVFALANPTPEIMPEEALKAGATVVASGRSDFANQINNVLAFPGVFQAVVRGKLTSITHEMKQAASDAIASAVEHPTAGEIIPSPFHPKLAEKVANAILKAVS